MVGSVSDPDPDGSVFKSPPGSGSSKGYWAIKNPLFMLIINDLHLILKHSTRETFLVRENTYFSGWKTNFPQYFCNCLCKNFVFFLPGSGSVLKSNPDPYGIGEKPGSGSVKNVYGSETLEGICDYLQTLSSFSSRSFRKLQFIKMEGKCRTFAFQLFVFALARDFQ